MNIPPRNPQDVSPKIADDLAALLSKSIAREPADRFSSANEFKEALARLKKQDY
jgi:serine/threonine-protein kinase